MSPRPAGSRSRFKVDWYLVLIISMVVLASLVPVRGEIASTLSTVTKFTIALVFFLHGARLSREAIISGMTHWRLHLVVLGATFVLFPLLCLGVVALPAWITPPALAAGIVFLGCLPSTIQSSIGFTVIGKGNVAAAVAAASASNLLGIFLTPILVSLLLRTQGTVDASSVESIVVQLLLPFVAGQVARPWIGGFIKQHAKLTAWVDRGSILLVVYTAFSSAVVEGVWTVIGGLDLARLLIICSLLLALVLLATMSAARALRFSKADEVTILFCGSKKSLASGVPMAGVLFPGPEAGLALLPLMLFHQIQLMACAVIAQRYANRPDIEDETV